MSAIESARRTPNASIPQVVLGVLVTLFALLTVEMAALTAWVQVFGLPGGVGAQRLDELGQPYQGLSQLWHQYGPLLWAVHALVVMVGIVLMWRTVLSRPPRAAWLHLPVLLALCAVFWILNLDRFYL